MEVANYIIYARVVHQFIHADTAGDIRSLMKARSPFVKRYDAWYRRLLALAGSAAESIHSLAEGV